MKFKVEQEFSKWISSQTDIQIVAVVGGTSADTEVRILLSHFPNAEIHYFGIENKNQDKNFTFIDLNQDVPEISKRFSLVLCVQVLEHVWNINNAFVALSKLSQAGSFLWLNCPASNIAHGSPEYFSAGYTSEFLAQNLILRGFYVHFHMSLGSKRYYFMTHSLRFWAKEEEHNHPILKYNFQPGSLLGVSKKFILDLPGRILSLFYSDNLSTDINFATESFLLAQTRAE